MKYFFVTAMFLVGGTVSYGQVRQRAGKLFVNTAPGGIIEVKDMPVAEDLGTIYLEDDWSVGSIRLKNERDIENYPIRYDLENNRFEFNYHGQVRVLPGSTVTRFEYVDKNDQHRFYERSDHLLSEEPLTNGFMEVVVAGDPGLYLKIHLNILKPSYVTALDVGERSSKIVKKEIFYFLIKDELIKLPSNRKKFTVLLHSLGLEVNDYIKTHRLDVKDRVDLIKIANFLNADP
ncbi:hypothetical protein FNH22_25140 [Fulvivirga sp. M361]|uniref:hypothetical protein n=1 Tax=Fulvivirga sp. M361 TaxID=2594266 RepID=UPI00117AD8D9|nr:hypothetical protein [Fulvivirga sp. M361]TRX50940.1 hypothetical protein FNH22_25140 [Fulvivirga sp. M361]